MLTCEVARQPKFPYSPLQVSNPEATFEEICIKMTDSWPLADTPPARHVDCSNSWHWQTRPSSAPARRLPQQLLLCQTRPPPPPPPPPARHVDCSNIWRQSGKFWHFCRSFCNITQVEKRAWHSSTCRGMQSSCCLGARLFNAPYKYIKYNQRTGGTYVDRKIKLCLHRVLPNACDNYSGETESVSSLNLLGPGSSVTVREDDRSPFLLWWPVVYNNYSYKAEGTSCLWLSVRLAQYRREDVFRKGKRSRWNGRDQMIQELLPDILHIPEIRQSVWNNTRSHPCK
jgi:hypothetical protein